MLALSERGATRSCALEAHGSRVGPRECFDDPSADNRSRLATWGAVFTTPGATASTSGAEGATLSEGASAWRGFDRNSRPSGASRFRSRRVVATRISDPSTRLLFVPTRLLFVPTGLPFESPPPGPASFTQPSKRTSARSLSLASGHTHEGRRGHPVPRQRTSRPYRLQWRRRTERPPGPHDERWHSFYR